jgi:hypothetical protein
MDVDFRAYKVRSAKHFSTVQAARIHTGLFLFFYHFFLLYIGFIAFLDVKVLPKFWGPVLCDGLENLVGFSKGLSSSHLLPSHRLPDESCQGLGLKY